MNLEIVGQLLDAAKAMTGSDYKTAKLIHAPAARVTDWRKGRTTMPVADIVLVANLAGLDAVEWGSRAIAAQHEGTEKGAALSDALKKALVATGEADDISSETGKLKSYFIRCINCLETILPFRKQYYRFC